MDVPDPSIDQPEGMTAGPDGALWFTNAGNNSIGRIITAGAVTNYTDPSIDQPESITTGPDGALWFTNAGNNSIGRVTTTGVVTNYTDPSIDQPESITTGPDGALWFTNAGNNSIGRISTSGAIIERHRPLHRAARRHQSPGPTVLCGSPTPATTPSAASPPQGW